MVLGADVGLQETCRLAMCGSVGRLSYAYLSDCSVPAWIQKTWEPILVYLSEIHYLTKGWIGFICRTPEDATLLLDRFWSLWGSTLMLKRWRVAFDPTTEYFQRRHLWVLPPALPLHLWNEGAMKAIGNALGRCITLDFSSLTALARKMGRIMVEIDIHEGLPKVLDIEWRGRHIKQCLDYQGIPFRCNWCHSTSHLQRHCPGKVSGEMTEDLMVQEDPLAYMDEDLALGIVPSFSAATSEHFLGNTRSLTGKIKEHCPSLFYSLSKKEKEVVDSFEWLLRSTTFTKGIAKEPLVTFSRDKEPLVGETTYCTGLNLPVANCEASPSPTISVIPSLPDPLGGEQEESVTLHFPTLPALNAPLVEASFKEPEEESCSLHSILDSLVPFIKDNDQALKLPTEKVHRSWRVF